MRFLFKRTLTSEHFSESNLLLSFFFLFINNSAEKYLKIHYLIWRYTNFDILYCRFRITIGSHFVRNKNRSFAKHLNIPDSSIFSSRCKRFFIYCFCSFLIWVSRVMNQNKVQSLEFSELFWISRVFDFLNTINFNIQR